MVDYTEGGGYQYHVGLRPGDVGEYVILPGDPHRVPKIAAYFDDTSGLTDDIMGEYMLGLKEQSPAEVRRVCHD